MPPGGVETTILMARVGQASAQAVSAVASGLSGNPGGIAVADFSLRQEAQTVTPNGVYAQVAESANIVYLWGL